MFHTIPEAELPIPKALAENGERLWQWVEFGLHAPYFLATIEVSSGTGAENLRFKRHLLVSKIGQLESLVREYASQTRIRSLSILNPCHSQDKDDYSFAHIDEVWEHGNSQGYIFVLRNGERIKYPAFEGEEKTRLVFDMK